MKRTHHCNQLRSEDIKKKVTLIGWLDSVRDHGGVMFVDLRDREGVTQVVFNPHNPKLVEQFHFLKPESVVEITGIVQPRPQDTVNEKLATGAIEVMADTLIIHSVCETLPFPLEDEKADKVGEELRLTHRYLDLRRRGSQQRLRLRHKASRATRHYLDELGFTEVEIPLLFKSTPEGAREFLVPSRLNPGHFYALAQSPQQYKQMLMVAGVERYYSFAKCFRDEDLRADRQPEFTQIDLEMSFIDREDIYQLIEGLLKKIWKETLGIDIPTPFPRMPFMEAMNRYGVDKPDTRFALEIQDIGDIFKQTQFKVFGSILEAGGVIKALNAKGLADFTQGELKHLEDCAKLMGAKGLAYIKCEGGEWKSPILKFLSEKEQAELKKRLAIEEGDVVFFAATQWEHACAILGRVRLECAKLLQKRGRLSIPKDQYNFLWVIDFPLISYDEEAGRYVSTHHPFTAPVDEDVELLIKDPKKVRGQHYDIVLNGTELGGGSIRIHRSDIQKQIFSDILAIPPDDVESHFGYMLRAFKYGTPPHGGIALGFDRLVAILSGVESIRDVIAFPKTQRGQDLMSMSPGPATDKQLKDLHIARLTFEDKKVK